MASSMTAVAHARNRLWFFVGSEPSKAAHGHCRAIVPRTPAIALASADGDVEEKSARHGMVAAWAGPAARRPRSRSIATATRNDVVALSTSS